MNPSFCISIRARRALGILAAVSLLATVPLTLVLSSPGEAAAAIGNDISFPQCGGTLPTGQAFGIVGVNDGVPDTENPCLGPYGSGSQPYLASELYWAITTSAGGGSQPAASLYVNTDNPGPSATDWPTNTSSVDQSTPDGTCALAQPDSVPCAWLYGADMANAAVGSLQSAAGDINSGGAPVHVSGSPNAYPWWLDVETGNTWEPNSDGQGRNVAVLEGMVAALQAAGAGSIGVYSTSLQWGMITGGGAPGNLANLPAWLPGAVDLSSAEEQCSTPSFTGGPVRLTQWTPNQYDDDYVCGSGPVPSSSSGPLPAQIYGSDAIGTAVAISQQEFSPGGANAVVLARSDFFSDALAGGPLAASVHGPLLITPGGPQGFMDPRVLAEIERVLPAGRTVYVLGGTLALPGAVSDALTGNGYTVVREAGANEYATAVDIAQAMGNPGTLFLATGLSFYDALSSVPAAISTHAAILLTDGNFQAPETESYLSQHVAATVYAIGGPLAAAGADPGATAVYGQDLFATSAAIASRFFPSAHLYGAATDASFADALGGGVFMATGTRSGALLLVDPSAASLSSPVAQYLATLPSGTPGYVFGGPAAVPGAVLNALGSAVG